jgi:hypothetical protein
VATHRPLHHQSDPQVRRLHRPHHRHPTSRRLLPSLGGVAHMYLLIPRDSSISAGAGCSSAPSHHHGSKSIRVPCQVS